MPTARAERLVITDGDGAWLTVLSPSVRSPTPR